jgi:nitrogen fixation protein NifU and related proteins
VNVHKYNYTRTMDTVNSNMYREIILDLYHHPLNKTKLVDFDMEMSGKNPLCGDEVIIKIKLDDRGKVSDISHEGVGCAISDACNSLITEKVRGMTMDEIAKLTLENIEGILGFSLVYTREACATLGLRALQRR